MRNAPDYAARAHRDYRHSQLLTALAITVRCPVCKDGVPGANCFEPRRGGYSCYVSHPERIAVARLLLL